MEDTYLQHEDRIQRALKHLSTKASYNLSAVARMFGVDLQRLRRRVKGINSRSTRPKVNQKLNSYQIKALELYIHRLDLIGQPPLLSMEKERILSQQRDVFKEHFCDLEEVICDKGIQQRDTWNFDECSFRIGISGSQDVIIMEAFKSAETPSETNRDFVSMVETINAAGMSESGYSNDQIALDYIKHFNKFTKPGLVREWRLLIYDGYGSHLTHEFITYCFENKIWPYALPPHSSHVLQPLDVVKRVEVEVRHGTDDFNKVEFLYYIHWIRKQAFKPATIKSAFKKTGIWPLNGDIVIDRLLTVDVRRATPPPPSTTIPVSPPTPVSAVDILAKAAVAVAAAREVAETDLRKQTMAAKHRQRRQIPDKRVVQKGGTVYVADARLRAAKRNKKDEEKGSRHKAVATLNALKANDPPRRR
ncbi:hypothetical protein K469DRAFT_700638 [Zopfia rhizophila CBS 207.26]|uniref:DDE-1 domain-containing protein n=1 Tax=Zopfia rhizophila CBS 207.26 TaxID=1314779 RepID=A0A6A6EFN0_9PEZI|nr:hypothetical protein K469DRAFT_700638 [Zopfia rhizophila CBS 207.26]